MQTCGKTVKGIITLKDGKIIFKPNEKTETKALLNGLKITDIKAEMFFPI